MLEIKKESIFALPQSVSIRSIRNEVFFLFDAEHGKQYDLTEMEYTLIDRLKKGHRYGDILVEIQKTYDADPDTISNDLEEYLETLVSHGLLLKSRKKTGE